MSKRRAHYCVRVANDICEQIALGKSLEKALEIVGPLAPRMPTFWRWLDEYPEFLEKYQRARQMQADMHADRMLDMAQEVILAPSKATAIRVAADILKWQAEIRNSKVYGSKVVHEHKQLVKPEEVKKEIARLEAEFGIRATPAMNTAPRQASKPVEPEPVAEETAIPAPPPNPPWADEVEGPVQ